MFDHLLTKEELATRDEVIDFVNSIDPALLKAMDKDEVKYPKEYLREAGRRNILGLRFPKQHGGRGGRWALEMAALEEIAHLNVSLSCLYSLVSIVGEAINYFGDDAQKKKYLAPMLRGELTTAEALTEPRGGSDFFGATCRAVKKGDRYILNGQKRFVVGSEGADFFLVYAKTAPEAPPHLSMSVFLVDRAPGVEVAHLFGLMGTRGGGTGRIIFRDVEVPEANRIGPENAGGLIFNRMMIPERLTSAFGAVGGGFAAIDLAARYSNRRKAFGKKIRDFQAVSFMVADAVAALDAARGLNYAAAQAVDADLDARRLVSEAKKIGTEACWKAVNNAMQIMGGIGYTNVFPIERMLRDARLSMIWTGTNEIMNLLIQHEYYKELLGSKVKRRDIELDAAGSEFDEEKNYGE